MKITIYEKVLSGNMGDGWRDNMEAANTYAGFYAARIEEELKDFGAELNIDIDVEDATGWSANTYIDVEGIDAPAAFNVVLDVEDRLAVIDTWREFCTDDRFQYLYSE